MFCLTTGTIVKAYWTKPQCLEPRGTTPQSKIPIGQNLNVQKKLNR